MVIKWDSQKSSKFEWVFFSASHFRLCSVLVHQQVCARSMLVGAESLNFFLAEKCRWTWVTLSPGFSESGSPEVAWRRRSARVRTSHVLHMYCTCQRRALGWGVGGVNRNIQGIVHYASMISINKTMCDFDLSWCTVQVSYLTVILGVTVSPNLDVFLEKVRGGGGSYPIQKITLQIFWFQNGIFWS